MLMMMQLMEFKALEFYLLREADVCFNLHYSSGPSLKHFCLEIIFKLRVEFYSEISI